MVYYFDMDGVLADFHSNYTNRSQALSYDYLANLNPFVDNVNLVKSLIAKGALVYILTKAANEAAKRGKIDWLNKYIPEIKIDNFICIVGYGKKVDYMKEDGILIDDDIKNTRQWEKANHKAILLSYRGESVKMVD